MAVADYIYRLLEAEKDVTDKDIKIDELSSSFAFIGFAKTGSLTSAAAWKVARVYRQGGVYNIEYADGGGYNKIWDDRQTIFAGVPLITTHSINFDAVNDYVSFGDNFTFEHSQAFSISLWVKPNNVAAQRCLISKVSADANVYGYSLQHTNTGALYLQLRATGALLSPYTFTSTLTAGVWQHVVLTYTGASNINGARAYLNGSVGDTPASGALSGTWANTNSYITGARGTAGFPYSGNITQQSIWNKALSAAEVTELYNTGQPSDLNNHSAAANLLSWWKMGTGDTYPTLLDSKGSVNGTMTNQTSADIEEDVP